MNKHEIIAELLLDESFQAWALSEGKVYDEVWQNRIKNYPDQAEVIEEAKMLSRLLKEEKYAMPEDRKDTLRHRLLHIIQSEDHRVEPQAEYFNPNSNTFKWVSIAASIAILISFSWYYFQYSLNPSQEIQYKTAFGEIKTYVLPDCTQVTLNGNSFIKYQYKADESRGREVWLEGEGFFDVSHTISQAKTDKGEALKFVVHTDNLSIKVLGTRFNVKSRHEKTQVVLEKGSIQLDIVEQRDSLLMQPDEMVEVKKGEKLINQKIVETIDYTAWMEGKINFESASYEEISNVLNDNYGLEIHFMNENNADSINLRGSFPTQNIDILLEAIANVTHTTMKKKGKTIIYQ